MRVALLVPGPFDTVSGGYGYDRAIVAGLRALGHAVDVHELDGQHPLADDAAYAAAAAAWHGMASDAVPVIDGLCMPAFAPLAGALAARGAVGLIHHPIALEPGHEPATRDELHALERRLFPALRRAIVTSRPTGERLAADFDVDPRRIACVEPGTADAPRSQGSGGPGCAVLSVGVLTPRKGFEALLRALAMLPDLDWSLTIAGGARDKPHALALQQLVADLGLCPRVTFAGEVVAGRLEELWQHADVFALASRYEGYGMAVAEAVKRGLPVATTDTGAAQSLVSPDSGVVCPVGDIVTLGKSLRRMIYDTALRADMGDAAWRAGKMLPSWQTQAQAFAAALAS